jgi:hypothetical protein
VPLALAHLLNHRPAEARALLLDAREPVAVLLRAVGEHDLGTAVTAAGDDFPELASVVAAARRADPAPRLFVPDRSPAGG